MSNKTVLNNGQRQWQHTWIEDGVVKGYVLNPKEKATVPSEIADKWLKSDEVVLVVDAAVESANKSELEALRAENAMLKALKTDDSVVNAAVEAAEASEETVAEEDAKSNEPKAAPAKAEKASKTAK